MTCLEPVIKRVHAIIQPHTLTSMFWQVLMLETFKIEFICLLVYSLWGIALTHYVCD